MELAVTRERIIEAAIEVFLDKGYAASTVREICGRAKANVAAVNYYFNSKEGLYAAVLESIMSVNESKYPIDAGFADAESPEERLRLFIYNLMRMNFPEEEELFRRGKLFWLEMGNPSPAFGPLIEKFMRPIKHILEDILGQYLGTQDPETLRHCAGSVAGQCLFHAQSLGVIMQLYPDLTFSPEYVGRLSAHIFQFSLAGLAEVRSGLRRGQ